MGRPNLESVPATLVVLIVPATMMMEMAGESVRTVTVLVDVPKMEMTVKMILQPGFP